MTGCCPHCWDGCHGGTLPDQWQHHRQHPAHPQTGYTVAWDDDHCPMCAEAEGVASWLRLRAGLEARGREALLFAADGITARP